MEFPPAFWLALAGVLVNFVAFLAVLGHKDKNRDKELQDVRESVKEESERLKRTKSELYNHINKLNGEIIGLTRDISHVKEGLSESNNRLNLSIADFKIEMVKSETRITQHVDNALAIMKDTFREALAAFKSV